MQYIQKRLHFLKLLRTDFLTKNTWKVFFYRFIKQDIIRVAIFTKIHKISLSSLNFNSVGGENYDFFFLFWLFFHNFSVYLIRQSCQPRIATLYNCKNYGRQIFFKSPINRVKIDTALRYLMKFVCIWQVGNPEKNLALKSHKKNLCSRWKLDRQRCDRPYDGIRKYR